MVNEALIIRILSLGDVIIDPQANRYLPLGLTVIDLYGSIYDQFHYFTH